MLEEGSFRGRTADFVFMFLFGGILMTVSFQDFRPQRLVVQHVVALSAPMGAQACEGLRLRVD